ncbi:MAG TPA: hypothetical protein VLL52_14715 [Anaerolineae bacterium]|nr:hypothetical protein [Anaerolineae bacterium]
MSPDTIPTTNFVDNDTIVETISHKIDAYGLRSVSILLLDITLPFSFFAAQLLWVAQPALQLIWPAPQITMVAHLLEDKEQLQLLQQKLEQS